MGMKVLVACEESQAVCKAFRALGHEAYSCDIQECSGGHPEWHIQGDVLEILNPVFSPATNEDTPGEYGIGFWTDDELYHFVPGKWDLIIAHPPCTYMSNAGACRMYPHKGQVDPNRLKKAMEAKDFFMKFYNADCERICIENPMPMKIVGLPKETQRIQPHQFGHPYTKKTYLWLKGLPNLEETDPVNPIGPYVPAGTSRKDRSKYGYAKRGNDSKNRSKTFPGIAKAMAEQWSVVCKEEQ